MTYKPTIYQGDSENSQDVINWISNELAAIESGFFDLDLLRFATTNVAPAKPRDGDIRKADGTHWNPGSGAGVYAYYGAAWVKL